jgi:hypothetical protein
VHGHLEAAGCIRQPTDGRLYFADIAKVVIYCPNCAEREFGLEADAET